MKPRSIHRRIVLGLLLGSLSPASAGTITISRNVDQSLKPDIVYFRFDDPASSRDVSDLGPQGLTGVLEAGPDNILPKRIPGPTPFFKRALNFNYGKPESVAPSPSPRGNHVMVPSVPALDLQDTSFTMGAWIKVTSPHEALMDGLLQQENELIGAKHIASKGGATELWPGWEFCVWFDAGQKVWSLAFRMASNDGKMDMIRADLLDFEQDTWQHVGVTFDAQTRVAELFFNGNPVLRKEMTTGPGIAEQPLSIGERSVALYGNFGMSIDEFFLTTGVHSFASQ